MVSFVEQATLQTIDKSSTKIRDINKELMSLKKTADSLKKIDIKFDSRKIVTGIKSVTRELGVMNKAAGTAKKTLASLATGGFAGLKKPKGLDAIKTSLDALSKHKSLLTKVEMPGLASAVRMTNQLVKNIQFLKANKTLTVTVNNRQNNGPGGRGPGGPRNPNNNPYPRPQPPVRIQIGPLQSMLNGFLMNLGNVIASSIVRGFVDATTGLDVAESRLVLQGMTPEQQAVMQKGATDISRETPQIGRGPALALIAESLTSAQGIPEVAVEYARLTAELIKLQTIVGVPAKQAESEAISFVKSAEAAGQLTDPKTGKFNPERAQRYFDTIERGAVLIGEEFSSSLVSGFLKYSQTTKYTLNERGLIAGFLAAEESSTSAGVGLNQAVKQLTGERIQKKQLKRLVKLGLISDAQVMAANAANPDSEEINLTDIFGPSAVNEQELRANFTQYVADTIIPKMTEMGLDSNDPQQVAKFAGYITSDRTATRALAEAIIRSQEILAIVDMGMKKIDPSSENLDKVADQSLTASIAAAGEQLLSVMGQVGNSFEFVLIPALQAVSDIAQGLTEFLAGPDGKGSMERTGTVAVGAAGVGFLGLGLFQGLMAKLNPFAVAATSLTTAGVELQAAAALLAKGAVVPTVTTAAAAATTVATGGGLLAGAKLMAGRAFAIAGGYLAAEGAIQALETMGFNREDHWLTRDFGPLKDDLATRRSRMPQGDRSTAARQNNAERKLDAIAAKIGAEGPDFERRGRSKPLDGLRGLDITRHIIASIAAGKELRLPKAINSFPDELDTSSEQLRSTFTTGANEIGTSAEKIGPAVTQDLLANATNIGTMIGQAAAAALANVKLGVSTPGRRAQPDYVPTTRPAETGAMTPF